MTARALLHAKAFDALLGLRELRVEPFEGRAEQLGPRLPEPEAGIEGMVIV